MNCKNKSFMTKRRAFTLIELLIVIAIIGILFIVLVSKVDFATDKAKATGVQTDFRSFQLAFEQVAKENSGFNTLGWDAGDTNGDRVRNSYDVGDTNQDGVQDAGETWTGRKTYTETWTGVYTLIKPGTNVYDADVIAALESAINANLDPKLHITISTDGIITMANGAQDPWKNEYHGRYLSNAGADKKDRGVIIMYSDGANGVNGSADGVAGGLVNITTPGSNVDGKDDYALATVYTYANGYGEVKSITYGFSNNQSFGDASAVPATPVGQAPSVVVPTPGDHVDPQPGASLPAENPSATNLDNYTWEQIKALAQAKLSKEDYKNKYGIEPGVTKTVNGVVYMLVDLGLDDNNDGEYDNYDGFVFMYNSETTSKMNSSATNKDGYAATDIMKDYVHSLYTSLQTYDAELYQAIKQVNIICNKDGHIIEGIPYTHEVKNVGMFLASMIEVGVDVSQWADDEGYFAEGTVFDYFVSGTSSTRKNFTQLLNISSAWWLRSTTAGLIDRFCQVGTSGSVGGVTSRSNNVVVPCFVIG